MRRTHTILDEIVAAKKKELAAAKKAVPLDMLLSRISRMTVERRDFAHALRNPSHVSLIAEIKKASPSAGLIRADFDHVAIAREYQDAGVDAISVLTERQHFLGEPGFIHEVRAVTSVPILRKDFVIDSYQIYESRALGADAILLIAGILSVSEMAEFIKTAHALQLDCLVETHSEIEVEQALACGARIIGINNRDLKTFNIDLGAFARLARLIPKDRTVVCESGIRSGEDVAKVAEFGADAVLVGTSIMKAPNISQKIMQLKVGCAAPTRVKICGITRREDALFAAACGADFLGFIFFEGSPRRIEPMEAAQIITEVKKSYPSVKAVGVFVNPMIEQVLEAVSLTGIDMIQLHGHHDGSVVTQLRQATGREIVAAAQVRAGASLGDLGRSLADYLMLDAYHESQYGGTGKSVPLGLLTQCLKDVGRRRVFVAGGIGEDNIGGVLALRPYAVDVNSRIELSPGVKDHDKIKRIFTRVREVQP